MGVIQENGGKRFEVAFPELPRKQGNKKGVNFYE